MYFRRALSLLMSRFSWGLWIAVVREVWNGRWQNAWVIAMAFCGDCTLALGK